MNEQTNERLREESNSYDGLKFFKGICLGFLFSIPIWVIIGLVIRHYLLA